MLNNFRSKFQANFSALQTEAADSSEKFVVTTNSQRALSKGSSAARGEVGPTHILEEKLRSFLSSTLDGRGQLKSPVTVPPGNDHRYPCRSPRAGLNLCRREKYLVPTGNQTQHHPARSLVTISLERNIEWYDKISFPSTKFNDYKHRQGGDSSVGIATRYRLDGPGIESRWGGRDFPYPASYRMSTGSFPGVKRPGRGVEHPFPI